MRGRGTVSTKIHSCLELCIRKRFIPSIPSFVAATTSLKRRISLSPRHTRFNDCPGFFFPLWSGLFSGLPKGGHGRKVGERCWCHSSVVPESSVDDRPVGGV